MREKIDLVNAFIGYRRGQWIWCLHCQRCYKVGEYREVVLGRGQKKYLTLQMCPYPGCDGDTVFDAHAWWKIEEPERGKIYNRKDR
jgi:hypothetical protein